MFDVARSIDKIAILLYARFMIMDLYDMFLSVNKVCMCSRGRDIWYKLEIKHAMTTELGIRPS
jgi:hypothetical protein